MAKYLDSVGLNRLMEIIKAAFVTDVTYNSTSKKIQKSKAGSTSDVVTLATVATSGSYNDLSNKPTIPSGVSPYDSNPAMDGTASPGSSNLFARGDHVHPTDTSRAANTDFVGSRFGGQPGDHGLVPAPPAKTGAAIGSKYFLLDDGYWHGGWMDLYFDTTADEYKLRIRYMEADGTTQTTLWETTIPAVTTTDRGMMRATDKVKLDGIAAGAEVNVQSDWNQSDNTADDYIKNKPTIPTVPNPSIYHAVCETAASTAAKTATLDDSSGFPSSSQLTAGVVVAVTFMNGNSAASPTLNIQDTGAYPLRIEGRSPASTSVQTAPIIDGNSTCTLLLTFNGSQWIEYEQYNGFNQAAWKNYQDATGASALSSAGSNLVTERTVYHGLPKINNAHNYTSGTNIYAPTSAGTSGYYLKANGGTSAPTWQAPGSIADGDTSLVTGDAVYDAIQSSIAGIVGNLIYKGAVSAASGMSNFKKGWSWIASAAFTIGSGSSAKSVEVGDMLIANADGTSATTSNIDVIQTNIDTLTTGEVETLWANAVPTA